MKKSDIFWQSYLSLEKELIEMSKFIYIGKQSSKERIAC